MAEIPAQGMAVARDGTKLAYQLTKGKGKGRVALVHSLAMTGAFWNRVEPLLEDHADVLTYDCRGHGASDKPAGPYTVDLFADDLADLLDHVGWDKAVVAGASMGGCVSIAFADRYGDRVAGLGLFDTTSWYGEDAPKAWEQRAMKAKNEGLSALTDFQQTRWFSDAFRHEHPDILRESIAIFLANDINAYVETCRMLGAADKREALAKFDFPCRILVGEEDYATPVAMAEALNAAIKGSTMKVIERARHLSPLEVPDRIAAALSELVGAAR